MKEPSSMVAEQSDNEAAERDDRFNGNRQRSGKETRATLIDFATVCAKLGYRPGEFVSFAKAHRRSSLSTAVIPVAGLTVVNVPAVLNAFYGVNPTTGPARENAGRGRAEDVTRLAALYVDLDIKPGACKTMDIAQAIIAETSIVLGSRPSFTVHTGHGLHGYWAVADGDITDDANYRQMQALMRRFGRLIAATAATKGAAVDAVFDLPRIMRLPGSVNNKTDQPVPVVAYDDTGLPLTVAHIEARLDAAGHPARDDDLATTGEIVTAADDWTWAEQTCSYVAAMIDRWRNDTPNGGRHPWLVAQCTRLAAAHRNGCITEADHARALKLLTDRFTHLCRTGVGGDEREPHEGEIADPEHGAVVWGIDKAARKTDVEILNELGSHTHARLGDADDFWGTGSSPGAGATDSRAETGQATEPALGSDEWLSDSNISRIFANSIRGLYCWAAGLGWMRWDSRKWATVPHERIVEESRLFATNLVKEAAGSGNASRIRALTRRLSNGAIRSCADLAKGQLLREAANFDQQPDFLNVANGVVDLRTGKLTPHDPELLFTRCSPTAYRPDATHPDWDTALSAAEPAVADWLQVRFGQAATGHPTSDDVLPVLHGTGANGKTTLTTGIIDALGEGEFATVVSDRVLLSNPGDHPTEMMSLRGARLAMLEETPEARHLNVKRLKDVLGSTRMTARHIRQDSVTWSCTHSLFLSSNYRPNVDETDHGTWRRLALVTFPFTFRSKGKPLLDVNDRSGDPRLRDRIKHGHEGQHEAVLAWLVKGAQRWYAGGRMMPAHPAAVVDATRQWRVSSDLILRLFDDLLVADPGYYVPGTDLYEAVVEWLETNGHRKLSAQTFASRFSDHEEIREARIHPGRVNLATTDRSPSRRPRAWNQLPMRFRAWIGVRFRMPVDDYADHQMGPIQDESNSGTDGTDDSGESPENIHTRTHEAYPSRPSRDGSGMEPPCLVCGLPLPPGHQQAMHFDCERILRMRAPANPWDDTAPRADLGDTA